MDGTEINIGTLAVIDGKRFRVKSFSSDSRMANLFLERVELAAESPDEKRPARKPFDLEAAKSGAPIVTREGRSMKFIAHVPDARPDSRVLVLSADSRASMLENNGVIVAHSEDGSFYSHRQDGFDLFMLVQKKTVYVNLYDNGYGAHHDTEQAARSCAGASVSVLAVAVPVEIEV